MNQEKIFQTMQEAFNSLKESEIIKVDIVVNSDLVLLGKGSPLDSLGFVTFMTELEDRISRELDKEIFFQIMEITDFNVNKPFISAQNLSDYIQKLIK